MKIKPFQDTDTLYIEFKLDGVVETKDLAGNICAITVEHAKNRADLPHFSFEQPAAPEPDR